MQIRPILLAVGIMTLLLGLAMLPSALIDIADGGEDWAVFTLSAFGSVFIGTCLALMAGGDQPPSGPKEAFLLTVLVWVMLPFIGAIPFLFAGNSLTDSVFESVSGLTTTGSTVFSGLDAMPRGILLWRSILQWIGGIGIIVTAIAILPMLRVGGMQLFEIESSDVSGKFLPRVTEIAAQTGIVYLVLSVLCGLLYNINGMNTFDSVAHAMTTMAAGGYSTHDAGLGHFGNGVTSVAILFMILAGLPFASFVLLARGEPGPFLRDSQPRIFLAIIAVATIILMIYNSPYGGGAAVFEDFGESLRITAFSVVATITGTGYTNANYAAWGPGSTAIFLILMFLGGCAGSAACGLKIFRLEIAFRAIVAHVKRMTSPHRLSPVKYNGRVVEQDTIQSVLVFVFLYLATFVITAVLLGLTGLDGVTAISGAASAVSNVGPGLGSVIGPVGSYQSIPETAKWICSAAMLLGRLEFVAMFVVLTPRFWRG